MTDARRWSASTTSPSATARSPCSTSSTSTSPRGEKVAIIGPSGSGKTTVLRMLMTLETINDGVIWVDGEPLTHMRAERRAWCRPTTGHIRRMRAKIGMVFQHFNLFPHMTALQNCIEAPMHRARHVARPRRRARAPSCSTWSASPTRRTTTRRSSPAASSSAWRSPARCAMRPKVMLFDEVTSALDPELVGEVLNVIRKLGARARPDHADGHPPDGLRQGVRRPRLLLLRRARSPSRARRPSSSAAPKNERTRQFLQRGAGGGMTAEAADRRAPVAARARFERIYRTLRDRICLLDYPPGARLSEEELARRVRDQPHAAAPGAGPARSRGPDRLGARRRHHRHRRRHRGARPGLPPAHGARAAASAGSTRCRAPPPISTASARMIAECDAHRRAPATPAPSSRLNMAFVQEINALTGNLPLREISERLYFQVARVVLEDDARPQPRRTSSAPSARRWRRCSPPPRSATGTRSATSAAPTSR